MYKTYNPNVLLFTRDDLMQIIVLFRVDKMSDNIH